MKKLGIAVITQIAYLILKAISASYRYRYVGIDNIKLAQKKSPHHSFILASWHQNLMAGILAQGKNRKKLSGMASRSKDAEVIARVASKLGIWVVRGSSRNQSGVDKGGKEAKNQMVEYLKQGISASLTIDGPKGPAKKAKAGALDLSRKTGSFIIPYFAVGEKMWTFNSWDQFRIPKPFTKVIVFYGKPFLVEASAQGELFQKSAEELNHLMNMSESELSESFNKWDSLERENKWATFC